MPTLPRALDAQAAHAEGEAVSRRHYMADEMDLAKWERIRQDEHEAAQETGRKEDTHAARTASSPAPASSRIYRALRNTLVAIFLFVHFGIVGRLDANVEQAVALERMVRPVTVPATFPPRCQPINAAGERLQVYIAQRRDMNPNWTFYCGYDPEGGTRTHDHRRLQGI